MHIPLPSPQATVEKLVGQPLNCANGYCDGTNAFNTTALRGPTCQRPSPSGPQSSSETPNHNTSAQLAAAIDTACTQATPQFDEVSYWNEAPSAWDVLQYSITSAVTRLDRQAPRAFVDGIESTPASFSIFRDTSLLLSPVPGPSPSTMTAPETLAPSHPNHRVEVTNSPEEKHQRRQLWNVYTSRLVNVITAHKSDFRNPLIDFLLPRALESQSFRSAILYLAFVMKGRQANARSTQDTNSPVNAAELNKGAHTQLGTHLEEEALSDTMLSDNCSAIPSERRDENRLSEASGTSLASSASLNTLATLLVLCAAYISAGNSGSFMICLEQAFILAKKLFEDLVANSEFTFLVRWLGYIHTTAMLSPGQYDLKSPDFLTIIPVEHSAVSRDTPTHNIHSPSQADSCTDPETHSRLLERSAIQRIRQEFRSSCFDDIIPTTGISNTIAILLYQIGRLSRLRVTILQSETPHRNHWFWGEFEAELDGLELQITQVLRRRKMRSDTFETLAHRLCLLEDEHHDDDSLREIIDLNRYNDALIHCALIMFLDRIKDADGHAERILSSARSALRLCAAISEKSHTGKLLALPLYVAGSWAETAESRSFVRGRLGSLAGEIVADTGALLGRLEARWNPSSSRDPDAPQDEGDLLVLY